MAPISLRTSAEKQTFEYQLLPETRLKISAGSNMKKGGII